MLKIFSYKGHIGFDATGSVDTALNTPAKNEGQVGIAVALQDVQITAEAKQLLLDAPMVQSGVGALWFNANEVVAIGGVTGLIAPHQVVTSSRDDLDSLKGLPTTDIEVPEDFCEAIDNYLRAETYNSAGSVEIQEVS